MRLKSSHQQGFTLLEIIVVLAVLGALATLIAPSVFRYVEEGNVTRAQADVTAIGAAVNKMYKDTGRWPFYEDGDDNLSYTSGTDAALLSSNASCTSSVCSDSTLPVDGTSGSSWALSGIIDGIANQIVLNTPLGSSAAGKKYTVTGTRGWKGPYVDQIPPYDPWGRSYVVNIVNADPGVAAASQKWVLALSSGPNGTIDTPAGSLLASNSRPTEDDIIARVR